MGAKKQANNADAVIERAKSLITELSQKESEAGIENGTATSWLVDNIYANYAMTTSAETTEPNKMENHEFCEAVCMLEGSGILTSETLKEVVAASNKSGGCVVVAQELTKGLQNLAKLNKYGMDTPNNQEIVILAGPRAVEASLGLWEKRKVELQAVARKSEHSSMYNNPAARNAAKVKVGEQLKEVSASLNHPVSKKAAPLSPSKRGG